MWIFWLEFERRSPAGSWGEGGGGSTPRSLVQLPEQISVVICRSWSTCATHFVIDVLGYWL